MSRKVKPVYDDLLSADALFERWAGKDVIMEHFAPEQVERMRRDARAGNHDAAKLLAMFARHFANWRGLWCTPCRREHLGPPASLVVLTPLFDEPLMPDGKGSAIFPICAECTADPLLPDRWVAIMKGGLRERALAQAMHPERPVNDDSAHWPVTHGWGRA